MGNLMLRRTAADKVCMIVKTVICESVEFAIANGNQSKVVHISPETSEDRQNEIINFVMHRDD